MIVVCKVISNLQSPSPLDIYLVMSGTQLCWPAVAWDSEPNQSLTSSSPAIWAVDKWSSV